MIWGACILVVRLIALAGLSLQLFELTQYQT